MLKKSVSIVLASLRGSTYRSVRLASSLAAALLNGPFEHPAKIFFLWSLVREGFPYLHNGLGIEAGRRQFVVRGGSDIRQAAILFE
jgi:hypothetical protein